MSSPKQSSEKGSSDGSNEAVIFSKQSPEKDSNDGNHDIYESESPSQGALATEPTPSLLPSEHGSPRPPRSPRRKDRTLAAGFTDDIERPPRIGSMEPTEAMLEIHRYQERLATMNDSHQEIVADFKNKLREKEAELHALQVKNDNLTEVENAHWGELARFETTTDRLRNEISISNKEVSQLKRQMASDKAYRERMEAEFEEIKEEKAKMKSTSAKHLSDMRDLSTKLSDAYNYKEQLEGMLKQCRKHVNGLLTKNGHKGSIEDNDSMMLMLEQMQKDQGLVAKSVDDFKSLQEGYDKLQKNHRELEERIAKHEAEAEPSKEDVAQKDRPLGNSKEHEKDRDEIVRLTQAITELESQLKDKSTRHDDDQTEKSEDALKRGQKIQDGEEIAAMLHREESAHAKTRDDLKKAQQRVDELELASKESDDMASVTATTEAEPETLNKSTNGAQRHTKQWKAKADAVEKKGEAAAKTRNEYQTELEAQQLKAIVLERGMQHLKKRDLSLLQTNEEISQALEGRNSEVRNSNDDVENSTSSDQQIDFLKKRLEVLEKQVEVESSQVITLTSERDIISKELEATIEDMKKYREQSQISTEKSREYEERLDRDLTESVRQVTLLRKQLRAMSTNAGTTSEATSAQYPHEVQDDARPDMSTTWPLRTPSQGLSLPLHSLTNGGGPSNYMRSGNTGIVPARKGSAQAQSGADESLQTLSTAGDVSLQYRGPRDGNFRFNFDGNASSVATGERIAASTFHTRPVEDSTRSSSSNHAQAANGRSPEIGERAGDEDPRTRRFRVPLKILHPTAGAARRAAREEVKAGLAEIDPLSELERRRSRSLLYRVRSSAIQHPFAACFFGVSLAVASQRAWDLWDYQQTWFDNNNGQLGLGYFDSGGYYQTSILHRMIMFLAAFFFGQREWRGQAANG